MEAEAAGTAERPLSAGELLEQNPKQRPAVIDGMIRVGQHMNIIAAPKMRKSWLATYVGLCLINGRAIFDRMPTAAGRVLLVDNELHREDLAYRIRHVADGMGLAFTDYADTLDVLPLRGKLVDLHGLGPRLRKHLTRGSHSVVILDAIYRFYPPGFDENSNADWTRLYNHLDQLADEFGVCFILIHHASKGIQGGKGVTDVGAGAGAQSRACDAHVILRPHEEPDAAVMELVNRSFAPVAPIGLRWAFPLWHDDPGLDVTRIQRERGKGGRPAKERAPKPEKPEPYTAETFANQFVTAEPATKDLITAVATDGRRMPEREALRLLALAEHKGLIHRHTDPTDKRVVRYANRPQSVIEATAK